MNGESNPCFKDGYSDLCSEFIRTRYNLTFDAFVPVRNHIKLLVDAGRLRTPSDNPIHPFEVAMGCYAIGQLPAEDCASCEHCAQQQTAEVCDVFCSSPAPNTHATTVYHYATTPITNLSTTSTPIGFLVFGLVGLVGLVVIFAVAAAVVLYCFPSVRRKLPCCGAQNCMLYLFFVLNFPIFY